MESIPNEVASVVARLRAELSAVQAQHLHEVDELAAQAKIMNALRAEVERLKALGSWAHTCIHHTDAERQSSVACPVCATAKLPWLHGATENSLTQVVDGTIDGGCIDDRYTIIRVPVSPFGYRVGQPVKVILPKVLVN